MSGIAGTVHFDNAPVDRSFIAIVADALAFRGPDAQHIWTEGSVGFAHTLLATTYESEGERQPASLDGEVWITADARIDGREDLAREIGLPASALHRPDCELILHSYAKWGETCVEHLLGDFAFAIWDGRTRKLFCARDHFGVKPFYYSHIGSTFLFSNTLNCIRIHPDVSDELNELAVADFLIFDFNQDPATTTFTDIQRLPAAHALIASATGVTTRRYWSLPEGESIRYRRTRDYVDHFRSLLESAVSDRLRTRKVAIMMSGGLDSPSVAAFARKTHPEVDLRAHTIVYDWLIPDDERRYAGLVASHLNIPITFHPIDHVRPFQNAHLLNTPEPVHNPLYPGPLPIESRVTLTGDGANALFCLSPFLNWASTRTIRAFDTAINFARYTWDTGMIPRFRVRSTIRHLLGHSISVTPEIPEWINTDFVCRCGIRDRVTSYGNGFRKDLLRPYARWALHSLEFTADPPPYLKESRHPYFDVRLVRYLFAIPELPYSMDKHLLRLTLKGTLPDSIRTRPKTPLKADPIRAALNLMGSPRLEPHRHLSKFINVAALPLSAQGSYVRLWSDLKPATINQWLAKQEKLWKLRRTSSLKHAPPTENLSYASTVMSLS